MYNNPDVDLYYSYIIPVSTVYFYEGRFIERLNEPGVFNPELIFIDNNRFAPISSLDPLQVSGAYLPLDQKDFGAAFVNTLVPDYKARELLPDTLFNGDTYHRLRIVSENDYSVFYIHRTDTVLPYSLSKQFDRDYKGVLDRIDTYDYKTGEFYSLRMSFKAELPESIYNAFNSK